NLQIDRSFRIVFFVCSWCVLHYKTNIVDLYYICKLYYIFLHKKNAGHLTNVCSRNIYNKIFRVRYFKNSSILSLKILRTFFAASKSWGSIFWVPVPDSSSAILLCNLFLAITLVRFGYIWLANST